MVLFPNTHALLMGSNHPHKRKHDQQSRWSWNSESNREPTLYESVTLPVELFQHRCHPETMAMSLTPPIQTHYDGSFDSVKGESWINHRGIRDCRDRKQALIPKMILAGAVGFEPTNNGVKVRCVTASPYPYICRLMQRRPAKPTCNRLPEQALTCRKGISFNA